MKVYIVAEISGFYMFPVHPTVYKSKASAEKKANELKEKGQVVHVLVADNWHKEEL